ncbi:unnamed protein product [Wuchereria bancrofti]|uniref:Uncharacterized protein n=1 Tax=Wuchereria bancrofti TaxID=6293 RepID=A0A3P7DD41_WUCBA|nr:unnamed protein product [Wuchereria bancrofti]
MPIFTRGRKTVVCLAMQHLLNQQFLIVSSTIGFMGLLSLYCRSTRGKPLSIFNQVGWECFILGDDNPVVPDFSGLPYESREILVRNSY